MPSIADLVFVTVLTLLLGFRSGSLLGDTDTGYHVRAGEYMIETLSVPKTDIFSQIAPPPEWIAHEWLSEVVFALIHKAAGLTGIVVFSALIVALTYAVLLRFLQARGAGVLVSVVITALAASASALHWLARPHLITLLFMLAAYAALDLFQRTGSRRLLYLLPPLVLLWVNLHGGFLIGLVLIAIYILGNLPGALKGKSPQAIKGSRTPAIKALLVVFALCLGCSLINPYGYKILLFPFRVAGDSFLMDNIQEWLSPDFHMGSGFEYMLLMLIVLLGVSAVRLTFLDALLILSFTHLALYSARYIPLFAIIASPIIAGRLDGLARNAGGIIGRLVKRADNAAKTDSLTRGHSWPAAATAVVVYLALSGGAVYDFDKSKVPEAAVEFVKQSGLEGNMFSSDSFGDYIIYAAWPRYRVFIDGRLDMYGSARLKDYIEVARIKAGMDDVLRKYDIEWIIFETDSPLTRHLLERADWRPIYKDGVATIFIREASDARATRPKTP